MDLHTISEGDLLAYLEGEDLPYVAEALTRSPELQRELAELQRTRGLFTQLFAGLDRPAPQDLVDVIAGQASPTQQLRVAAYLRQSAAEHRAYQELEQEFKQLQQPARPRRSRLPEFLALPVAAAAGLRAAPAANERDRAFVVAELQARITLRIVPRADESWVIEGFITRAEQAAADVRVRLTAPGARPRPRQTDAAGFFSFLRLRAGTYQLRAAFDEAVLRVEDIVLQDD
jgi:hypothetical protein